MSNLELPRRSLANIIAEGSICIALSVISIIGNSLVCIAASRNPKLRSTANLYIIAIAFSDLLVATVDMPLASATLFIGGWVLGDVVCHIQGFVDLFAFYITPATLGLTSFSRYLKIVKTNHYTKMFSTHRSKIWLSCLWLSFAIYLIIIQVTNWIRIGFVQSYAVCAFTFSTSVSQIVHFCVTVGLLFILPLCIGIFSYYKIYIKTHEHQQNVVSSLRNRTEIRAVNNTVKEINISRVLMFVAAGFLCCWVPSWALVLWFRFSPETSSRTIAMLVTFCFFVSSSINPFIYAFTNGEFRREFRKLLCCRYERKIIVPKKAPTVNDNDVEELEERI